jgi:hypothetical protein
MAQSISDSSRVRWPDGKKFAFTIFDDPDFQTPTSGRPVYEFLTDIGIRSTKGVWPGHSGILPDNRWGTCMDPTYLEWILELQHRGFEIGWHGSSPKTSSREESREGLQRFCHLFGHSPQTMSQHYDCLENVYWGDGRLSGPIHRSLYHLLTKGRNNKFTGNIRDKPNYWSDLCSENVKYVRNFVYSDINTLAKCPLMPYHDPDRPDVNYWYASSEGANLYSFNRMISERNQDRLEADGGACIMYTHFAYGFVQDGKLDPRFRSLMERLSKKNGWFVPVARLLDWLMEQNGPITIDASQRRVLERHWLLDKIRFGSA